jgi:NADPH-dependent 7-cyano-7-deazaguanine reductase QueF-like protein
VEAGADFWVTNEIGFTVKGGYRFCNGTTSSNITADNLVPYGTLKSYMNSANACKIDYSGFFIQLGVNLNFARYD